MKIYIQNCCLFSNEDAAGEEHHPYIHVPVYYQDALFILRQKRKIKEAEGES